jgi:preprotein translocase subunit SecB
MAAAFTFDEYKLIEISYKPYIDNKYQNEAERAEVPETQQSNISVTSNIAIGQPEDNKYRMELIISITGAVHANIILYGFFTGMNFYESKERELQELTPIGMSLLLPIARSMLASVSAQDGSTPFMLPTINISEMLEETNSAE